MTEHTVCCNARCPGPLRAAPRIKGRGLCSRCYDFLYRKGLIAIRFPLTRAYFRWTVYRIDFLRAKRKARWTHRKIAEELGCDWRACKSKAHKIKAKGPRKRRPICSAGTADSVLYAYLDRICST